MDFSFYCTYPPFICETSFNFHEQSRLPATPDVRGCSEIVDLTLNVAETVRLFDIKYKGERIIYELGLQEAIAH